MWMRSKQERNKGEKTEKFKKGEKTEKFKRVKERQVDGSYYRLHYIDIDAESLKVDHLKLERKLLLP